MKVLLITRVIHGLLYMQKVTNHLFGSSIQSLCDKKSNLSGTRQKFTFGVWTVVFQGWSPLKITIHFHCKIQWCCSNLRWQELNAWIIDEGQFHEIFCQGVLCCIDLTRIYRGNTFNHFISYCDFLQLINSISPYNDIYRVKFHKICGENNSLTFQGKYNLSWPSVNLIPHSFSLLFQIDCISLVDHGNTVCHLMMIYMIFNKWYLLSSAHRSFNTQQSIF